MKRNLCAIGLAALALHAAPSLADGWSIGNTPGGVAGGGALPAAGSFTTDTGGLPTLSQVNGTTAKVFVKHVSCGQDCWTHGLTSDKGNLNVTVKMGFTCPAGDAVEQIYYSVGNSATIFAYQYKGGVKKQSVIATATIQPWTPAMFEGAAISALGPSWSGDKDDHHNTKNTAKIAMHQDVKVFGNCLTDQATGIKVHKVHTMATIIDQQ